MIWVVIPLVIAVVALGLTVFDQRRAMEEMQRQIWGASERTYGLRGATARLSDLEDRHDRDIAHFMERLRRLEIAAQAGEKMLRAFENQQLDSAKLVLTSPVVEDPDPWPKYHKVLDGETPEFIAGLYQVPWSQIAEANGRKPNRPLILGETLKIVPARKSGAAS